MSTFTDPRTSEKIQKNEKSEKAVAKIADSATAFLNPEKVPKTQKVPKFKQPNPQKLHKELYHG